MTGHQSLRWLPVDYRSAPNAVSVKWMDFGVARLTEPFFAQTVRRLQTLEPAAPERVSGIETLIRLARNFAAVPPAGVIFHVSRCGSTLVSNALGLAEEAVVLSEARPVVMFFDPDVPASLPLSGGLGIADRNLLLNSVVALYASTPGGAPGKVVIKCHTIQTLQISRLRAAWPTVPFLVVIRDPVEVLVSNLAKAAGWVAAKQTPSRAEQIFGWAASDVQQMSLDEYCARGLGQFYEAARGELGPHCRVIDYASLRLSTLRQIAAYFSIALPPEDSGVLEKTVATYAKDPTGAHRFENDCARKQRASTEPARRAVQQWAREPYEFLRSLQAW